MGFRPAGSNSGSNHNSDTPRNLPVPKDGNRKARVSLIVDLGIQNRKDYEETDGTTRPQKPAHQIAVFADLTADTVDYGGSIGKQHYRLMLNKSFKGEIEGISFFASAPKDADGNTIPNRPWGLHVNNAVSKIAAACGHPEWSSERQFKDGKYIDIEPILGQAFLANVQVKLTPAKDKTDADGNPVVYKNVNYKGASALPEITNDDGEEVPMPVPPLKCEAMMIGFDTATEDQIKWIRADIRRKIKTATNYAGSKMQKAIEAYEAKLEGADTSSSNDSDDDAAPAPKPKPKATAKAAAAPAPKPAVFDDMDDDVPFAFNMADMGVGGAGKSKAGLRAKHGKGSSLHQANRAEF